MTLFKKIINSCLLASIGSLFSFQNSSFKTSRLKNGRVKVAYNKHWAYLQALLAPKKISKENFEVYGRVFKDESILQGSIIYTDIYPFKFTEKNQEFLMQSKNELHLFWNTLKTAYDYFEETKCLPKITTDLKGNYLINAK